MSFGGAVKILKYTSKTVRKLSSLIKVDFQIHLMTFRTDTIIDIVL